MTAVKLTLAEAQAERSRLADAARDADAIVDKLEAEALALRQAKRGAWAERVLAGAEAERDRLTAAEREAERAFCVAAVEGDAREAYFHWMTARAAVNVNRDRRVQARVATGLDQGDNGYPITDQPQYSAELDRALSTAAEARYGELATALTVELNDLDTLP